MKEPKEIVYDGVTWVKSELLEGLQKRVEELENKVYELETLAIDETTQKIKVDVEIEEQPKVDFSILNDTDVFWCRTDNEYDWLFCGNPLKKGVKCRAVEIDSGSRFIDEGIAWTKQEYTQLRKATPEECEIFYKHFPEERPKEEKRKVWIEGF